MTSRIAAVRIELRRIPNPTTWFREVDSERKASRLSSRIVHPSGTRSYMGKIQGFMETILLVHFLKITPRKVAKQKTNNSGQAHAN